MTCIVQCSGNNNHAPFFRGLLQGVSMGFEAVLNRDMLRGTTYMMDFQRLRRDMEWLRKALKLSPEDKTLQEELVWKEREYDRVAGILGLTKVEGDL